MYKVTMTARGQVLIPAELRNKLGLRAGTSFTLHETEGKILLVPEYRDPIGEGMGFFKKSSSRQEARQDEI